jgi:hypothetical protein
LASAFLLLSVVLLLLSLLLLSAALLQLALTRGFGLRWKQLSDFKSYNFAPRGSLLLYAIQQVNDSFLRRAFRFVVRPLSAAAHIYAGDLFDHLREADNTTRLEYEERFQRIFPRVFPAQDTEPPDLFVEGNHDVGLGVVCTLLALMVPKYKF